MRALSTAATGMAAQQLNVEVISNNIANMNTVGFKRQRAEFQDLLYQDLERAGAQSSSNGNTVPTGIQVGAGVKTGSVYRIMDTGSMTQTGNPLDLAIKGRGYFQVQMPNGDTAYTRAGNLSMNQDGQLVTSEGYLIQPQITVPQIDGDGEGRARAQQDAEGQDGDGEDGQQGGTARLGHGVTTSSGWWSTASGRRRRRPWSSSRRRAAR